MKRDYISEIVEIQERNKSEFNRLSLFISRMQDIRLLAKEWLSEPWDGDDERCRVEALRYVPIALIASIEGWLHLAVRDMIDNGEPFISNANGINMRLDYDFLIAISSKKLTAGEIVSHFVSCSKISDIFSTLNKISGNNIANQTREVVLGNKKYPYKIHPIFDEIVKIVEETFKLRHIIAHEMSSDQKISSKTIVRRVGACQVLITAIDHVIEDEISRAKRPLK